MEGNEGRSGHRIHRRLHEIDLGDGPMNPRLHLAMHEIVATQLWDDSPPEVWETAARLLHAGYERHEIFHMLSRPVADQVGGALRDEQPYDEERHIAALRALPGSDSFVFVGAEAAPGTLGERWQLLGLRGENSGSAGRCRAWNAQARERTRRCGCGRDGCVALLRGLWFFRDRLDGVNSPKRSGRGGEIQIRAAALGFRLQLDHVPRDG
jgi:hypothetical protein